MRKALEKWRGLPIAVKVSSAYVFCTIVQRCLLFLTTPLFTRLLTTEQYGQIVVYTSWQSVLQIFLTLNLAYGSFSNAMLKFEDNRDGYMRKEAVSPLPFLIRNRSSGGYGSRGSRRGCCPRR